MGSSYPVEESIGTTSLALYERALVASFINLATENPLAEYTPAIIEPRRDPAAASARLMPPATPANVPEISPVIAVVRNFEIAPLPTALSTILPM